jgi:molecular chaperone DnaK
MSGEKVTVGIDLGTTNTVVASVKNRIAKVVPTDRGHLVLPSVVSLSIKNEILVGGVARDQSLINPKNTIYGSKRLIGRKYNSPLVQELKKYFSYEIVEGPEGDAAVKLGDQVYRLPDISALVLARAKLIAEQSLGVTIDEAVITVPAYYNDAQRNAVKEAGALAGFTVKRIVSEPTAAALAYGVNRRLQETILVYDLGGGTFDVSVMKLNHNNFEVIATGGDTFLGGLDFDNRIVDFLVSEFTRLEKLDLRTSPIAMQRIKTASEAAKIDLSVMKNVTVELPFITERKGKPVDLRIPLSREQLNTLTADLVERTFSIIEQVIKEKQILRSSIQEVILVGGQSRMPLVQERISKFFGRAPRKGVHPDECVAIGAALLGDSYQTDALTLIDVLSMPIGYALTTGRMRKIIEKNSKAPSMKSFRVPQPHKVDSPSIEIDIFQGDSEFVVDNEFLGTLRLPLSSAGKRIDFKLDEECLLKVFVESVGLPSEVKLATLDTPEVVRIALAERLAKEQEAYNAQPKHESGVFASLKRLWSSE